MSKLKASTYIFLDRYHPKADGKCAVSIRVTFQRRKRYFPTPYTLTLEEYDRAMGPKPRKEIKETTLRLQACEKRAAEIIGGLPNFTWQAFENLYFTNRGATDGISGAFKAYSQSLEREGRVGTASSYECARRSLEAFSTGLRFADVTPAFLRSYETWMLKRGKSATTVGIYLRPLRTLFNNAIADGLIGKDLYPFGRRKYEIPTGRNIKKSLRLEEVELIYRHDTPDGSSSDMAKDFWLFLYLSNGMNVKDLANLRYSNLKDGFIEFVRAKTARTKRVVEPIRIPIHERAMEVIKKWGTGNLGGDGYVFPILMPGLTPKEEREQIQLRTRLINDHMKAIGRKLGLPIDVTTYVARHSFATIMKNSGANTEFISEALGHANINTTKSYLSSFEDETKRKFSAVLTAFPLKKVG